MMDEDSEKSKPSGAHGPRIRRAVADAVCDGVRKHGPDFVGLVLYATLAVGVATYQTYFLHVPPSVAWPVASGLSGVAILCRHLSDRWPR